MIANLVLVLAAMWLLTLGSVFKVTGGDWAGSLLFKTLPIGLSFGLVLVALKLI